MQREAFAFGFNNVTGWYQPGSYQDEKKQQSSSIQDINPEHYSRFYSRS
jgi:hypothetical protein